MASHRAPSSPHQVSVVPVAEPGRCTELTLQPVLSFSEFEFPLHLLGSAQNNPRRGPCPADVSAHSQDDGTWGHSRSYWSGRRSALGLNCSSVQVEHDGDTCVFLTGLPSLLY